MSQKVMVIIYKHSGCIDYLIFSSNCTYRSQWGRFDPASDQRGAAQRCRCSSLRRGSSPCAGWWLRSPWEKRPTLRAAVRSRCLCCQVGSSAGSGSPHPASGPASEIHLVPWRGCRSEWRASPLEPPGAVVLLPCLTHPPWGQLQAVHKT